MKRWFLFIALNLGLLFSQAFAQEKTGDEVLRRTSAAKPAGALGPLIVPSFPFQFNELDVNRNGVNRAMSTGYYFVDSQDPAPDFWRPSTNYIDFVDTTVEPGTWRRIIQGPRLLDTGYWAAHPGEGLRFFRNPKEPNFFKNYDDKGNRIKVDSSYDAIAGPMSIGFGFYFNGIRFDSFYVSTNGVIALTNRRYFYDSDGNKVIPPGATSCYDPMSMDWFARATRTATGLDDTLKDDFGYMYSVLNNQPTVAAAGIRSPGGLLHLQSTNVNRGAYIAPFWGDMHLSQWNPTTGMPDDHGKVYFKREIDASKLTIYFVNIAPQTQSAIFPANFNDYTVLSDRRPKDDGYISANAQVVLNRIDSSIIFVYDEFKGTLSKGRPKCPSTIVMSFLSASGVTGWARDVNFNSKTGTGTYPWASEYQQTTHYWFQPGDAYKDNWPSNNLRTRFKQWKNSLRVVDIQYRVRKDSADGDMKFNKVIPTSGANDYELLAGEPKLGALQPVALIQQLTNDIQGPQGVNYTPQDVSFVARFRILNLGTYDNVLQFGEWKRLPAPRVVYNRFVKITQTCLNLPDETASTECQDDPNNKVRYSTVTKDGANYVAQNIVPLPTGWNGIRSYNYTQVYFPPFEPNEFVPDHIGRMRAFVIADAQVSPILSQSPLGGSWPFDDTASVNIVVMKRLTDFTDDVTEFNDILKTSMPSVYKWVNIGTVAVDGEQQSKNPLPPRGEFPAQNNTNLKLKSPAIQMNRKTIDNNDWGSPAGDILTSFPIDMRNKVGSVLSFSVQRTSNGPTTTWDRGWSDQSIVGVEPRIVTNSNIPFVVWNAGASVGQPGPDSLLVEFMKPSPDRIRFVTNNRGDSNWRWHPRRPSISNLLPSPVLGLPAFALFGGGGYFIGWDEKSRNEPLVRELPPNVNGLRANIFDDGIDWEFKRFSIAIPDTFITAPNDGGKNFRFRIRVNALNHKKCMTCIPDDDDDFFIDNVRILFPSVDEITDVEVTSVKVLWPYEMAPASQATEIPVKVVLNNNTSIDSPTFRVKVKIFRGTTTQGDPIYCRTWTVTTLNAGRSLEVPLPTWNARRTGPGTYRLQAMVILPNGDLESTNDTTYSDTRLVFGDAFAYDDINNEVNSVPEFINASGIGISMFGQAYGGTSAGANSYTQSAYMIGGNGAGSGNGNGQIATRFTMLNTDTIYGFQTLFGEYSQAMDDISYSIYYSNDQGTLPANQFPNSTIIGYRGLSTPVKDIPTFKEYIDVKLADFGKNPIVLNKGTYWVVIGQMGLDGLHLGASKYRMGMRTTVHHVDPQTQLAGPSGRQFMIDKQFRISINNNLDNYNFFAFENTRLTGLWNAFMPSIGNPAYAHLHHYGIPDGTTQTFSRGSWIPMLRPFFGFRTFGDDTEPQICPDDIPADPVELMNFRSDARAKVGIDLFWETASEINNYGFYVEKRLQGEGEESWNSIGFIPGANNTSTMRHYNFTDRNVKLNNTYQYRLRQVDFDGTQYCGTSDIITETFDIVDALTLVPNSPNPVTYSTKIDFNMPSSQNARLEVLDLFGNVVRVLADQEFGRGHQSAIWDTRNSAGTIVAPGTYIYRLTTGDEVLSGKMTVIR